MQQLLLRSCHRTLLCLCRQLPAIQGSSLKEKEEKGKPIPLAKPRTVDFIARALERTEKVPDTGGCGEEGVVLDRREASLPACRFSQASSLGVHGTACWLLRCLLEGREAGYSVT